jgi:hypothetical protein
MRSNVRNRPNVRPSVGKVVVAFAVFGALPLAVACEHRPTVVDAGLVATATVDAWVEDAADAADAWDAWDAADAADAAKKPGVGLPTNVVRLKQCCNQLRIQAKAMGVSPEAGLLLGAAAQCDTIAAQAGPSGNAPELGLLKAALAGRNVPPVCAGF